MDGKKLKELIHEYVEVYSTLRNFSPRTIEGKRKSFSRLLEWLKDRELNEETALQYIKHVTGLGWQPSSIKAELKQLRAFAGWLVKYRHRDKNFTRYIEPPKVPKKHLQFCSAEVAEKVIIAGTEVNGSEIPYKKARMEQRLALQFMLRSGLRVSECVNLKTQDINFETQTFQLISKGGNQDILPLPRDMIEVLRKRNGKRLFKTDVWALRDALKRGSKKLKVKPYLKPHSLRHIFATSLLRQGLPLQKVSRLMRHASVQLTDSVYSHYLIDDLKTGLNSYHPVIRQQLKPNEVFKQLEELLASSGLHNDQRFSLNVSRDTESMSIDISIK